MYSALQHVFVTNRSRTPPTHRTTHHKSPARDLSPASFRQIPALGEEGEEVIFDLQRGCGVDLIDMRDWRATVTASGLKSGSYPEIECPVTEGCQLQ